MTMLVDHVAVKIAHLDFIAAGCRADLVGIPLIQALHAPQLLLCLYAAGHWQDSARKETWGL
jgi:hypothetical protein